MNEVKYELEKFLKCYVTYDSVNRLIKRDSETMLCPNTSQKDEFILLMSCLFYNSFIFFFDSKIIECDHDSLKKTLMKAKDDLTDVYEFCKKNSLTLAQKNNHKGKNFNDAYNQLNEGIKKQYRDNQILSKADKAWKIYLSHFSNHFSIGNEYEIYEDEEEGEKCICNHSIHKIYNYVYEPLNVSVQVGSHCITKADPKNGEKLKEKHENSIEQQRLKKQNSDQCSQCNFFCEKTYEIDIEKYKFVLCNKCKNLINNLKKNYCENTSLIKNEKIRGLIEDNRRNLFEEFKNKRNNIIDAFKGYGYTYEKSFIRDKKNFENYTGNNKKLIFFIKEAENCIIQNGNLIYNDSRCKNCSSFLKRIDDENRINQSHSEIRIGSKSSDLELISLLTDKESNLAHHENFFCSDNCYIDFKLKKNCNLCGGIIYTKNHNFCSDECSNNCKTIKYKFEEFIRYLNRCILRCSECKNILFDFLLPSEIRKKKSLNNNSNEKNYCVKCQNDLMIVNEKFPNFLYFNIEKSKYLANKKTYRDTILRNAEYVYEHNAWKIQNIKKNDKNIELLITHKNFVLNKRLVNSISNIILIRDRLSILTRFSLKKLYNKKKEISIGFYEHLLEQFKDDEEFIKELKNLEIEDEVV
jgi:hypothetical protein